MSVFKKISYAVLTVVDIALSVVMNCINLVPILLLGVLFGAYLALQVFVCFMHKIFGNEELAYSGLARSRELLDGAYTKIREVYDRLGGC